MKNLYTLASAILLTLGLNAQIQESASFVKPIASTDQLDSSQIEQIERPQLELIDFYQDRRAGTQIRKQQQKKKLPLF